MMLLATVSVSTWTDSCVYMASEWAPVNYFHHLITITTIFIAHGYATVGGGGGGAGIKGDLPCSYRTPRLSENL